MGESMFFGGLSIRDIRAKAMEYGINVNGMDRTAMCVAIRKREDEIQVLRQKCVSAGLPSEGTESELLLRLEAVKPGTLTKTDHNLYTLAPRVLVGLGVAALVVSLPHLTGELSRVTGLHWVWCAMLALVIDGGVVAAKLVDVLGDKFKIGKLAKYNRAAMFICLGFSALVNASGFISSSEVVTFGSVVISITFALLISGFVWFAFTAAAYLLTTKQKADAPKPIPTQPKALTASEKLRNAADEIERLTKLASSI